MFAISKRSPPNENGTGRGGKTAAEGYGTQGARGTWGARGRPPRDNGRAPPGPASARSAARCRAAQALRGVVQGLGPRYHREVRALGLRRERNVGW